MYFSEEEKNKVVLAIKNAENRTSGEIKVHIEKSNPEANVETRTLSIFQELNLHETKERNGVLIYVATDNRQFAIFGDEGINKKVKADFWESTKQLMQQYFKENAYTEGLVLGINNAGEELARYFPYQTGDINEIPDDISFG